MVSYMCFTCVLHLFYMVFYMCFTRVLHCVLHVFQRFFKGFNRIIIRLGLPVSRLGLTVPRLGLPVQLTQVTQDKYLTL